MKKIFAVVIILLALAAGAYIFLLFQSTQDDLTVDRTDGRICDMRVSGVPLKVSPFPGIEFKFDTGSDVSLISRHHLDMLDSLGYKARKVKAVTAGRDGNGELTIRTERYLVDLPVYLYDVTADTAGILSYDVRLETLNVIRNVEFLMSPDDMSVIGTDFMEKFRIEFRYSDSTMSLYKTMPAGYEPAITLYRSSSPSTALWNGRRYYVKADVDSRGYEFFLDTGLQRVNVKMPADYKKYSRNILLPDTVHTMRLSFPASVDNKAWVSFGNRLGSHPVFYYDSPEESFAINPLYLIEQDLVLDLEDEKIMLRPFYDRKQNHNSGYN